MPHVGNFPREYPKPLAVSPGAFVPKIDTQDWAISEQEVRNRAALDAQYWMAPVFLPNGVTVTKLTLHGIRQGATDVLGLYLYRCDYQRNTQEMARVEADWTGGYGSGEDASISYATVANNNYTYALMVAVNPDTSVLEAVLTGALIHWN